MKQNIIFLFPDQHRGDWLPLTKQELCELGIEKLPLEMPNLRKIMDKGIHFNNAITPSPLCAPARACLASGKRYENCGVPNNGYDYPEDLPTFYSALKDAGYSVGGVGKFDLHKKTMWWGLDGWVDLFGKVGFTHAIDNAGKMDAANSGKIEPQDPYMLALHERGYAKYHSDNLKTRKHSIEPTELPEDLYCDNWLSQKALDMLEEFPKDKPWFMQVNFTGPHEPWDVTKSMREKWENAEFDMPNNFTKEEINIQGIRQNYAAMLDNIDRNIGNILGKIEEMGQLDNTVIVYASDHGEMLGDFDRFAKNRPERASVHIPMVISTPGMTKATVNTSFVELQDLANTFLDIANTSMETADESMSLMPIIKGEKTTHRTYQKSALNNWEMVKTDKEKIVLEDGKITRVYDYKNDIWENNNILK
ncbi:MAG: sulfatase-like hydrolase/transferase [Clostridia bacterium]